MSIIQSVKDIVSAPMTEKLDLKYLFLITGLVIVFTAAWMFILAHIKAAAMEVIE